LFEEIDKPIESKIMSEDKIKGIVERQSSWRGVPLQIGQLVKR
jgi:hypothetical protein